jgi:phosphoglycolate phosphatase-like HAD superfamily hydrolase
MPNPIVLFDVQNTLVKEVKDESAFLAEAIRGIYGFSVDVKESDYDGMAFQEAIEGILLKNDVDKEYINEHLERIIKELPYSYYNVAGHDRMLALDGAADLIKNLSRNEVSLGIVTGAAKGMVTNMFDRAGLDFGAFKFGFYGDSGKTMADIIKAAAEGVSNEAGAPKDRIFVVSSSPRAIAGAKVSGLIPIGVATGSFNANQLKEAGAKIVLNKLTEKKELMKELG